MKQSAKKTLINKISTRLLGLKSKCGNAIKSKTMKSVVKKYSLVISKNGNENSSVRKTEQNGLMLLSNYPVCGKKWKFMKNQELSNFDNI